MRTPENRPLSRTRDQSDKSPFGVIASLRIAGLLALFPIVFFGLGPLFLLVVIPGFFRNLDGGFDPTFLYFFWGFGLVSGLTLGTFTFFALMRSEKAASETTTAQTEAGVARADSVSAALRPPSAAEDVELERSPRHVPLGLRIHLLFGGRVTQILWAVFGGSLVFFSGFTVNSDPFSSVLFAASSETTEGVVLADWRTNMSMNNRAVRGFLYAFNDETGKRRQATAYTGKGFWRPGNSVAVKYLPWWPEISKIQGARRKPCPALVGMIIALFPLAIFGALFSKLRHGLKTQRLLAKGCVGMGKLERRDENRRVFTFAAQDGETYEARSSGWDEEEAASGSRQRILYAVHNPGDNCLFPNTCSTDLHGRLVGTGIIRAFVLLLLPGAIFLALGFYLTHRAPPQTRYAPLDVRFVLDASDACAVFSADGNTLITVSSGKVGSGMLAEAKRWDVETGALESTTPGAWGEQDLNEFVPPLISPTGGTYASLYADGTARLWDTETGVSRSPELGHATQIWSRAFSADGKLFATGSGEFSEPQEPSDIKIWDVASGEKRLTLQTEHFEKHAVCALAFSPDGKQMASCSGLAGQNYEDQRIILWNLETGEERLLATESVCYVSLAFSPDGRTLVGGPVLGSGIGVWDVEKGGKHVNLGGGLSNSFVIALSFSPDARILAGGARAIRMADVPPEYVYGDEMRLWNFASKQLVTDWATEDPVNSVAISPDGRLLAVGVSNGKVKLLAYAS